MWRKYFKLKRLVPGRVVTQRFGALDFSGEISVETCKALYEDDFPYLEITEKGKQELYGSEVEASDPVFEPLPDAKVEPEKEKVSQPTKKTRRKRTNRDK
ncbi:hypothetical protein [Sunxiuqinia sp. sy24]|uniref:hypothetical protein n=1 Tax=Sunxiuqinia sp. sy24 TaxID=3461495 RepID=UPI0040465DD2